MACTVYTSNEPSGDGLKYFFPMSVDARPSSRVIGAPVENGQKIFDNKVRDPTRIIVTGYVKPLEEGGPETMTKIQQMFENRSFDFYCVDIDGVPYKNLILESCPCKKSNQEPDLVSFDLTFVEAILVPTNSSSPSNAEYSSTVSSGNAAAKSA